MAIVLFQWTPFIFSMKSGFIGYPDHPEAKLRSEKSQKKPHLVVSCVFISELFTASSEIKTLNSKEA